MRVLIVKTSSMGDIIHTLPALTDAGNAIPSLRFDWVVEENFAEIPRWHSLVERVIPIAWRRWRKNIFSPRTKAEWNRYRQMLYSTQYDYIIDAQGLLKSAWLSWMAKGKRCGLSWHCTREPLASLFYQNAYIVGKIDKTHAIQRIRHLFSQSLHYTYPHTPPDYGIAHLKSHHSQNYLVFIHGTTWATKHWPETYWVELANIANQHGLTIKLPWGNETELERAKRIAKNSVQTIVLPSMNLSDVAEVLASAKAVITVDTGLGHLATALGVPTVSLFGPTNPLLTGILGPSQTCLSTRFPCSPCFNKNCTYPKNSSSELLLAPPLLYNHSAYTRLEYALNYVKLSPRI